MDYDRLMRKARRHNRKLDAVDARYGNASPSQVVPSLQVRTVMSAIECGIKTGDWNCVAEGQAMLETLVEMVFDAECRQGYWLRDGERWRLVR
jgi:hypothetical protein